LAADLSVEDTTFEKGIVVDLRRIEGYVLGGVDESHKSCEGLHLHADEEHPEGILIDGKGPFADPDPDGCGYGLWDIHIEVSPL